MVVRTWENRYNALTMFPFFFLLRQSTGNTALQASIAFVALTGCVHHWWIQNAFFSFLDYVAIACLLCALSAFIHEQQTRWLFLAIVCIQMCVAFYLYLTTPSYFLRPQALTFSNGVLVAFLLYACRASLRKETWQWAGALTVLFLTSAYHWNREAQYKTVLKTYLWPAVHLLCAVLLYHVLRDFTSRMR
jgi:hypothetical protein